MQTTGIGASFPQPPQAPVRPGSAGNGAGSPLSGPFGAVFERVLGEVNGQQGAADKAIRELTTSGSDELHNVMLTVAKADLTFRLFLEIRNRLVDAYQEVMRMQV